MNSKDYLDLLMYNQKKVKDGFKFINLKTKEQVTIEDCYETIKKDLEILEILKKWIVVNETNDDLFPYEIKVKNGYVSNKSCLVLIEEDYKKIKEWLENDN